jgi:hypothetical protein
MPDDQKTHVICVLEGDDTGYSMTSPQLPGFVFARSTFTEFWADAWPALRRENVDTSTVVVHNQERRIAADGSEYLLRVAQDVSVVERVELAQRISQRMAETSDFDADVALNAVGEATFICSVRSDTVGWIIDQMDQRNDAVQLAVAMDSDYVFSTQFASGQRAEDWPTMADHGWTRETSVGELTDLMLGMNQHRPLAVLV